MTHVLEMSTDPDILFTPLDPGWGEPEGRYHWDEVVSSPSPQLPDRSTLVVIAHGNGSQIGNAQPGAIDINAGIFLVLIQSNMQADGTPAAVYISTCGPGIAQFAAMVRLLAEQNEAWAHTRIFGHSDPIAGSVPPPGDTRWIEIF